METYIVDAVRTPRGIGKQSGGLHTATPADLGATCLKALAERNQFAPGVIEEVVFGCVEAHHEQGADIARMAVLHAGFPDSIPGIQVNRFCSSALDAVNSVAGSVASGMMDVAIGGGVEMMSRVPMMSSGGCWTTDPNLSFETRFVTQGIGADLMATRSGYSREKMDAYAVESQRRAARAQAEGRFDKSLVTVYDKLGLPLLEKDELPRPNVTLEKLATMKPSFARDSEQFGFADVAKQAFPEVENINYVHHPGNSSGIVDGASSVLLASKEGLEKLGAKPRARIHSFAAVGTNPTLMFAGPGPASEKALAKAGMTWQDVDLVEMNEAFAVMPVWLTETYDLDPERVNVNGGAISLGHPLGATGGMLLGTVLDELERQDLSVGLVSLCAATGLGTTTIVERI